MEHAGPAGGAHRKANESVEGLYWWGHEGERINEEDPRDRNECEKDPWIGRSWKRIRKRIFIDGQRKNFEVNVLETVNV